MIHPIPHVATVWLTQLSVCLLFDNPIPYVATDVWYTHAVLCVASVWYTPFPMWLLYDKPNSPYVCYLIHPFLYVAAVWYTPSSLRLQYDTAHPLCGYCMANLVIWGTSTRSCTHILEVLVVLLVPFLCQLLPHLLHWPPQLWHKPDTVFRSTILLPPEAISVLLLKYIKKGQV